WRERDELQRRGAHTRFGVLLQSPCLSYSRGDEEALRLLQHLLREDAASSGTERPFGDQRCAAHQQQHRRRVGRQLGQRGRVSRGRTTRLSKTVTKSGARATG